MSQFCPAFHRIHELNSIAVVTAAASLSDPMLSLLQSLSIYPKPVQSEWQLYTRRVRNLWWWPRAFQWIIKNHRLFLYLLAILYNIWLYLNQMNKCNHTRIIKGRNLKCFHPYSVQMNLILLLLDPILSCSLNLDDIKLSSAYHFKGIQYTINVLLINVIYECRNKLILFWNYY